MRLTMLALIFLLILTLGNAWLYHRDVQLARARTIAPLQQPLSQPASTDALSDEWRHFIVREIGAIVITVAIFGVIASMGRQVPPPKNDNTSRLR